MAIGNQRARNIVGSALCEILSPDLPDSRDADIIFTALADAGLAIVPVEPTEAMTDAGDGTFEANYTGCPWSTSGRVWQAMVRAAQEPTDER